ncbi:unnamed protein product [Strongylus vulgaris]|uniref:Uncharacterized protein n=1 Tax=Strongylus vulgaris TaxID=40348 RepID=A0A3P7IDX2_STRVU|nr:unnamed protein product [Strongylus vulgaris]
MEGFTGRVMFTWHPNHPNRKLRSHIGDAIYLVAFPEISCALVPVSEKGCTVVSADQPVEFPTDEKKKVRAFFKKRCMCHKNTRLLGHDGF